MNLRVADMLAKLAALSDAAERSGFLCGVKFADPALFVEWLAHDAAEWEREMGDQP